MNQKSIHNGITDLKKIALTKDEKGAVLAKLMTYAAQHQPAKKRYDWQRLFNTYGIYATALCALIVVVGTIAYKAEAALPGEPLYAMKVGVNEPIQSRLASTPAAEASFLAQSINNRLNEAETLALESRLTSEVATSLLNNVQTGIEKVGLLDEALAKEGDSNDEGDVQAHLAATLDAHSRILTVVADNSDAKDKAELARLQSAVSKQPSLAFVPQNAAKILPLPPSVTLPAPSTTPAAATATTAPATSTPPTLKPKGKNKSAAYEFRKQNVEQSISQAENEVNAATNSPDPVIQAIVGDAHTLIDTAKSALEASQAHYTAGSSDQADSSLHDSKQAVDEAIISVKQSLKLAETAARTVNNPGKGHRH